MKKLTIALLVASIFMFAASAYAVTTSFSDVSTNDWFHDDVMNMADWGVIQGYPDGTFGPGNNVNRAELSAMWNRYDDRVSTFSAAGFTSDTATYPAIALSILSTNQLSSSMNDYHGTQLENSCELISALKDGGEIALDTVMELDVNEEIATKADALADKVVFQDLMQDILDECDAAWL